MDRKFTDINKVDSYIKVTTPSSTIILAALSVFFVAVIIWFFFGKVTDTSYLKGVIFPSQGIESVELPHQGLVRTLFVHKGDEVVAGQQLALVSINGSYSIVSATRAGTVLSYIAEGEEFEPFESIVNLLTQGQSGQINTVIALADFKASRDIKAGQTAQVTPSYDSRERIGFIHGTVNNVVPYPISRQEAEAFFENKSIVDGIFPESGAVFFISIDLENNPDNPAELHWSFENEEDLDTGVGTYCDIQVVVRSRSMYKYLMENIKEKEHAVELWAK